MTFDRLTEILDAHGADPARWPSAERDAALALLARSAEARARLDDAARLDDVLGALPAAATPSATLRARVLDAAPAGRAGRTRPSWVAILPPLAAAAAVLLVWLGQTPVPTTPEPHFTVPLAALGVYETPTDSLLTLDDLDVADGDPSLSHVPGRLYA